MTKFLPAAAHSPRTEDFRSVMCSCQRHSYTAVNPRRVLYRNSISDARKESPELVRFCKKSRSEGEQWTLSLSLSLPAQNMPSYESMESLVMKPAMQLGWKIRVAACSQVRNYKTSGYFLVKLKCINSWGVCCISWWTTPTGFLRVNSET